MKQYNSVAFLSVFKVSSPPARSQSPPTETQSPPIENFLVTVLYQLCPTQMAYWTKKYVTNLTRVAY